MAASRSATILGQVVQLLHDLATLESRRCFPDEAEMIAVAEDRALEALQIVNVRDAKLPPQSEILQAH